jgi:CRISPR-associated endoribonuclease Cas6
MPLTAIFNLRTLNSTKLHRSYPALFHPVFLQRIWQTDEQMGSKLHNAGQMVPFSLSPILGIKKKIEEDQSAWVRVCLLTSELEDVFFKSLEMGCWHKPIYLNEAIFLVEDISVGKQPHQAWGAGEDYQELIQSNQAQKKVPFEIATPMSFKKSDLHYPLPDLALIYNNLARRWNHFYPAYSLQTDPDLTQVSLSYFDLKTVPYALRKGGTIIGAKGRLTFTFRQETKTCFNFNLLLKFAFYSGIGVKTTQGMGMCRILSDKENNR